jgi:hypothetical protein
MNFWRKKTKVFALIFLFFVSFSAISKIKAQNSIYQLPPGTKIRLRMETEINSKVSSVNDTFITRVTQPVVVRNAVVLPAGTIVEGRVTKVEPAEAGGQGGTLELNFENLRFTDGVKRNIKGRLVNPLKAESARKTNILMVIGGTSIGAIFGAFSGKQSGALIGAGVGAGIGTGAVFLRKGKELRIKTDEEFEIELEKDVTMPVLDY